MLLGLGDGGGSQNPETSIHAHFGDGGGGSRQAEGGRTPKTSSRARFRGWQGGGGSKNPETIMNARFGDGGGRQRAAESRKRAVVLVLGVGRMVVAVAAGRGQVKPRKRAVVLAFGVGKMVLAAREYRNPENELNVLVFRVGQLVDWLTVCRIIF